MDLNSQLCKTLAGCFETKPVLLLNTKLMITDYNEAFLALPGFGKAQLRSDVSTVLNVDLTSLMEDGESCGVFHATAVKNRRAYSGIVMRSDESLVLIFGSAQKLENRPNMLLDALNKASAAMMNVYNTRGVYRATAGVLQEYGLESMLFLFDTKMYALTNMMMSLDADSTKALRDQWNMRGEQFLVEPKTLQHVLQISLNDEPMFVADTGVFLETILPPRCINTAQTMVTKLHIGKSFVVPMRVADNTVGIIMIMADDLVRSDIAAVTAFVNQMAAALEKAELIEDLHRYIKTLEAADAQRKELLDRLKLAVQAGQVGIWSADYTTRDMVYDDFLYNLLKIPLGEKMTYDKWIETIHKDDRERIINVWEDIDRIEDTFKLSFRVVRPDDSIRRLNVNGAVYKDRKGNVLRLAGACWDVTDIERAAHAHAQTLERLKMATHAGHVGIWEADLLTGEMTWDDINYELFNFSKYEKLTPQKWEDAIHPDDLERVLADMLSAYTNETQYDTEYRIVWPDGSIRYIKAAADVYFDEDGQAVHMVGTNWDVTDMRKTQQDLQRSERLLRKMFESLSVGVWRTDKDGNLLEGNPAAYKIWGGSRLVGMDEYGIYKARRYPSMEELAPEDWSLVRTIREGVTMVDQMLEIDAFDGNKKIILNDTVPLLDDDGNVEGAIILNRDITKQQKAEEELAAEKELLRTTLQSIGDGVVVTDEAERITMVNKEFTRLTDWTGKDTDRKRFDDVLAFVSDRTGKRLSSPVKRVLETQRATSVSSHVGVVCKNGSEVPISSSAAPIKDADGNVRGVVIVMRDMTEERRKRDKIDFLVHHDSLTGLYNRRYFDQQLRRLDAEEELPLSIISCDVNGLKLTNDAFGHAMGDKLLKKMAETIKKACRKDDIVVRSGGDEFFILLPGTDEEQAKVVCDRIAALVDMVKMGEIEFSLAVGYATKTDADMDVANVLKRAEDNMYRNKFFNSTKLKNMSINTVLTTLYKKSVREKTHSDRVSELSRQIGHAMALPDKTVDELGTAGLMHDIGKIALDAELLERNPINRDETQQMMRHPEIGFRILRASGDTMHIADDVMAHHERFDGNGYPKGLRGTQIPIGARVVAVANAFVKLVTDDPPGSALSQKEAVKQLERDAGTAFDPDVVAAFAKLLGTTER